MKTPAIGILAAALGFVISAGPCHTTTRADVTVLFDATQSTTMEAQGWPFLATPLLGHSVGSARTNNGMLLDSTVATTDRGGYFSQDPLLGILRLPDMPTLDARVGFSIRFTVEVKSEWHDATLHGDDNQDGEADRSGFSVIVVTEQQSAIELGFWTDRIWAQDDARDDAASMFTQAESVNVDTTHPMNYSLLVTPTRYVVMNNQGESLLSGRLRDYRPFAGAIDPYETPSFLFFGDNTTRAAASVQIGSIHVASHDFNADGQLTSADVDRWDLASRGQTMPFSSQFDVNYDGTLDLADRNLWLSALAEISFGDANFDGQFNSSDLLQVFQAGQYEDDLIGNSTWASGDWNGDGDFNSGDVLLSFQTGRYLQQAIHVPEAGYGTAYLLTLMLVGMRLSK